jgi:hypothetical protein
VNPSQLQLIVSPESVERLVAANDGSASDREGCDCVYGREAVDPDDDMFVRGIVKGICVSVIEPLCQIRSVSLSNFEESLPYRGYLPQRLSYP